VIDEHTAEQWLDPLPAGIVPALGGQSVGSPVALAMADAVGMGGRRDPGHCGQLAGGIRD
jgi:hypothetical protein